MTSPHEPSSGMSAYAFVFPGQGSQTVGMGADLAAVYDDARAVFEQADEVLGFSLSGLMFAGEQAELDKTWNTQPALFTAGIAFYRVLVRLTGLQPLCTAGHSLGELTALCAAGSLTFEDGLRLVRERGRLMAQAGEQHPGAMAALLGGDVAAVDKLCADAAWETGGTLVLANDNAPGQIVISGDEATLSLAVERAKEYGIKRAVRLAVSIAAHSPLMQPAAEEFRAALAASPFRPPQIPVYGNVNAAPLLTVEALRAELDAQLTVSVRWTEVVRAMCAAGVTHFIELGAKDVLTGLLRRIEPSRHGTAVYNVSTLNNFLNA